MNMNIKNVQFLEGVSSLHSEEQLSEDSASQDGRLLASY